MGLFDNIFLDKDTPTALVEAPENKVAPETPKKPEDANYDPKNDPIAPPVDTIENSSSSPTPEEVNFDIGGDIDFGNLSGDSTAPENTETTQGASEAIKMENTSDVSSSSIALVQGSTASAIDQIDIAPQTSSNELHIDIGGDISIGSDTSSTTETPSSNTVTGGTVDIHIHDIEEHPAGVESTAISTENTQENSGILSMLGDSKTETDITPDKETPETTTNEESSTDLLGLTNDSPKIEATSGDIASLPSLSKDEPTLDVFQELHNELPSVPTGGGRIRELISKLIEELKTLDEAEQSAIRERESRLQDIKDRLSRLEEEYSIRKKALLYEQSSLETPITLHAEEKARIHSLIAGFEKDIDSLE